MMYGVYMKRYQVYLNPHSVAIFDEFDSFTGVSRSKIIRSTLDSVAVKLGNLLALARPAPKGESLMDRLVGSIKTPGKKKTNYASKENIDEMYMRD